MFLEFFQEFALLEWLPSIVSILGALFIILFTIYLISKYFRAQANLERVLKKHAEEMRGQRDPWRVFKNAPKKRIYRRAGTRCEWFSKDGVRCENMSDLQIDHIYPWAAGGWTIEENAQVLCIGHHTVKGGLVPDEEYIKRVETQRAEYFPEDVPTEVRWIPTEEERKLHEGAKLEPGPITE